MSFSAPPLRSPSPSAPWPPRTREVPPTGSSPARCCRSTPRTASAAASSAPISASACWASRPAVTWPARRSIWAFPREPSRWPSAWSCWSPPRPGPSRSIAPGGDALRAPHPLGAVKRSLGSNPITMEGMRLLYTLACLAAVACAQSSTPVVSSVTPNPIDAGGPTFTLTVSLGAFVSPAVVKWSGTPLVTGYVDDYTLSAIVPAGLMAICGKYFVTVTNTQNNAVSNSYAVIVKPVLKSLSPNLVPAGSPGGTVTATGLGFSSNVYLTLIASGSQSNLATGYGGPTTLTAFVPTTALNGSYATVNLFVTDPQTGAVSQTLPITLTFASVSVISPNTITADIASYMPPPGGTSFPLAVGGANFVPGAQVLFDGAPLATVYNDSTYLTATVPAALVHDASADNRSNRLVGISVKNPGAAVSNSLNFVILPNPFGTTIVSLTPPSALAGAPPVTLTVAGERYVQGSTVMWILTPLPTTFVSYTPLTPTPHTHHNATASTAPRSPPPSSVPRSGPPPYRPTWSPSRARPRSLSPLRASRTPTPSPSRSLPPRPPSPPSVPLPPWSADRASP